MLCTNQTTKSACVDQSLITKTDQKSAVDDTLLCDVWSSCAKLDDALEVLL